MKTELLKSIRRKDAHLFLIFVALLISFMVFSITEKEADIGKAETIQNERIRLFLLEGIREPNETIQQTIQLLEQKTALERDPLSDGHEILKERVDYDEQVDENIRQGFFVEQFYPLSPHSVKLQNQILLEKGYPFVRENEFNSSLQALHKLDGIYLSPVVLMFFLAFFTVLMREKWENQTLEETLPLRKSVRLKNKLLLFFAAIALYFILINGLLSICFLIRGKMIGPFDYPVRIERFDRVLPIGEAVFLQQFYFFSMVILFASFLFLLTSVKNESSKVLFIMALFIFSLHILTQNQSPSARSFLSYLNIEDGWMLAFESKWALLVPWFYSLLITIPGSWIHEKKFLFKIRPKPDRKGTHRSLFAMDLKNRLSNISFWMILLSLTLTLLIYFTSQNDYQKLQKKFQAEWDQVKQLRSMVVIQFEMEEQMLLEQMKVQGETDENRKRKEQIEWMLEYTNQEKQRIVDLQEAYREGNADRFYEAQLDYIDDVTIYANFNKKLDGEIIYSRQSSVAYDHDHALLMRSQLDRLKENQLKPTQKSIEVWTTDDTPVEKVETIDRSAMGFYSYHYRVGTPLLILLGVLLATGGAFTKKSKDDESELYYQLLPMKKTKIYARAWSTTQIRAFLVYGIIQMAPFVLLTLLIGKDDSRYPVLDYMDRSGAYGWINRGDFLLQSIVLGAFVIFFLQSLQNLLSIRCKNPLVCSLFTVSICFIGYEISRYNPLGGWQPFLYLYPSQVTNHQISRELGLLAIHFYRGILILLVGALVLWGIGSLLYARKERRRI